MVFEIIKKKRSSSGCAPPLRVGQARLKKVGQASTGYSCLN